MIGLSPLSFALFSALFAVQKGRIAHFEQDFLSCCFLCALRVSAVQGALAFWLRLRCSKSLRLLCARPSQKGSRGGGIEVLMGRWVGATMGELPPAMRGWSGITEPFVNRIGVPCPGQRVFVRTRQLINGWEDDFKKTYADVPPPEKQGS
jgi:hypothetical protein